jgi:hypothetical protein
MVEELTDQLRAARDGINAAIHARDGTRKELDVCREELAEAYQRVETTTSQLRDVQVTCHPDIRVTIFTPR